MGYSWLHQDVEILRADGVEPARGQGAFLIELTRSLCLYLLFVDFKIVNIDFRHVFIELN